jgi:hypothetical protein
MRAEQRQRVSGEKNISGAVFEAETSGKGRECTHQDLLGSRGRAECPGRFALGRDEQHRLRGTTLAVAAVGTINV